MARWCRRSAAVERVGPFDLFHEPPPFGPKYARPGLDRTATRDEVDDLLRRQRELDLPNEIEGVHECHPWLAASLRAWGWDVVEAPLLVHRQRARAAPSTSVPGIDVRIVAHDDPDLARIDAIGHVAFGAPGMGIGAAGTEQAAAIARTHDPASNRERLRLGHMTMLAAFDRGDAVAYGSLLLDDGAPMAEIVAVGTLPSHRRRGVGSAVTLALVALARSRGVETVWLSAANAGVAALYERLGFEPIGTYVMASTSA